jgi:tetratricopeptide (TPR) repeat protein
MTCRHGMPEDSECKKCTINAYMKAYYQRPDVKERIKAYHKAYYERQDVKEHHKIYQQAYRQRPEVKEYYKTYMKAYYQRPDVKEHQKTYSRAWRTRNILSTLKEHYQEQKLITEKVLRSYKVPPIALQGRLLMFNQLIDNLNIIEKHTENLDKKIKQRTIETMVNQMLEKEGILISKRERLTWHKENQ